MTYFIKSGSDYNVSPTAAIDIHEALPVGTYTVAFDQQRNSYFLQTIESFEVSGKIYGDTMKQTQRILSTFDDRQGSTGVMLSGEKGSGKTLLAKLLSLEGMKLGIPTIVINNPWCGEGFNRFMQMINQPTIVIFDEFEKVYDSDDQEKMLTLLDGVYPSKKLFVITCNDKYRVNSHMKNRPGRIFYRLEFKGLDTSFIREYCEDKLEDKNKIDSVCRVSSVFGEFNFDILKAMVEEMNRYGETAQEVIKILNAKPEHSDNRRYTVALFEGDEQVPDERVYRSSWSGNPLSGTIAMEYVPEKAAKKAAAKAKKDDDFLDFDDLYKTTLFNVSHLVRVEADKGMFIYENPEGFTLKMSPEKAPQLDWQNF